MTFDEINKDLDEKLKQFQCNHCGNCYKGLPCPQDDKLFKFWKEYYESNAAIQELYNRPILAWSICGESQTTDKT